MAAAFFPNGDRFISKINGAGGGEMLLFQAKEGVFRIFCGDAAFCRNGCTGEGAISVFCHVRKNFAYAFISEHGKICAYIIIPQKRNGFLCGSAINDTDIFVAPKNAGFGLKSGGGVIGCVDGFLVFFKFFTDIKIRGDAP